MARLANAEHDDVLVLTLSSSAAAVVLANAIKRRWKQVHAVARQGKTAYGVWITNLDRTEDRDAELLSEIRDWIASEPRENPASPSEEDVVDHVLGVDNPHSWPKSEVQSLLFDTDKFTVAQAKEWAKEHGFLHGKVDTTGRYHRLRQEAPMGGPCRTKDFGHGVKAIVCSAGLGKPPGVPNGKARRR